MHHGIKAIENLWCDNMDKGIDAHLLIYRALEAVREFRYASDPPIKGFGMHWVEKKAQEIVDEEVNDV